MIYQILIIYCIYYKSKRITIILDDDLDKKLRSLQAKQIASKKISYSYSKIVNDTLRKGVK